MRLSESVGSVPQASALKRGEWASTVGNWSKMNKSKFPRFREYEVWFQVVWNPQRDLQLHLGTYCPVLVFLFLTSFLGLHVRGRGWCPEQGEKSQSRLNAALRISASAESRAPVADGSSVCQVSLLGSVCQGFSAVSEEAPDPQQNCSCSKGIYSSCWQGLLRGMLLASWPCPTETPLSLPLGLCHLCSWLFWETWNLILPACLSLLSLRNHHLWRSRPTLS